MVGISCILLYSSSIKILSFKSASFFSLPITEHFIVVGGCKPGTSS